MEQTQTVYTRLVVEAFAMVVLMLGSGRLNVSLRCYPKEAQAHHRELKQPNNTLQTDQAMHLIFVFINSSAVLSGCCRSWALYTTR